VEDEGKVRRFFTAEEDPGPLTGLALGEPAGRSVALTELRRRWREALGNVRDKMVLELGCGHGGELAVLVRSGAHAVGIDYSPNRLRAARRAAPGAGVLVADAQKLPFGNETFAVVYGNSILLHLDRSSALGETRRVLIPSGTAVFLEPLDRHPVLRVYRSLFTRRRGVADYPTLAELEGLGLGGGVSVTPWYLAAALPVLAERLIGSSRFTRGLTRLLSRLDAWLFRRSRRASERAWLALAVYKS
jgi:SAM-dependent methyltransferase